MQVCQESEPTPLQLDIFGPIRTAPAEGPYDLLGDLQKGHFEALAQVQARLRLIRSLSAVTPPVQSGVDCLHNSLEDAVERVSPKSSDELIGRMHEASGVGIEGSAEVCALRGVTRSRRNVLYCRAKSLMDWVLHSGRGVDLDHIALPTAALASIYGHPRDLAISYSYLDALLQDMGGKVADIPADERFLPWQRLHHAYSRLATKDKGDRPVQGIHELYLMMDREKMYAPDEPGFDPAKSTIELVRGVYHVDRNKSLAARILRFAFRQGVEFDEDQVRKVIVADRVASQNASLLRFLERELGWETSVAQPAFDI